MFTAEGADNAPAEEIGTQLGQGPPPVGQPDLGGSGFRQAADRRDLVRRDPCRSAGAGGLARRRHTLLLEGMEIGIDGIAMDPQQPRDRLGIEAGRVEQDRFGPAALAGSQGRFEQAVEGTQLQGPRFGNGQGTRHGWTSIRGQYNHFTKN